MIDEIVILGSGGHARDIKEIIIDIDHKICAYFADDDKNRAYHSIESSCIFRSMALYVIGANWPWVKLKIYQQLEEEKLMWANIIHPSVIGDSSNFAMKHRDELWGKGIVIGPYTSLGVRTELGRHVHIGAGCTLTRASVGEFSTIGPGVNIAGDVRIGSHVTIGVGASISNLITVGDKAIIGAGAVVVKDVGEGEVVAGVPAKVIGTNDHYSS